MQRAAAGEPVVAGHRETRLREVFFHLPGQPAEGLPLAILLDIRYVAVSPDAVPAGSVNPDPALPPHVRTFGACTADREMLADWLRTCGITSVAMESTGIYGVPLFELLERRGFQVYLVDPRQTRQAPGRPKSDVLDCQWIQRLHSCGLLSASFRPDDQVVVLRGYLRQRQMLIGYAGQHIQHIQKALEEMNVKRTEGVSDIVGVTGLAILKAILRGERDARALAKLRNAKCKRTEAESARALLGNWREEHLFALRQALTLEVLFRGSKQVMDIEAPQHWCQESVEKVAPWVWSMQSVIMVWYVTAGHDLPEAQELRARMGEWDSEWSLHHRIQVLRTATLNATINPNSADQADLRDMVQTLKKWALLAT